MGFSLWRIFAFPVDFPFWDMIVVERFIEDGFALGWTLPRIAATKLNEHRPVFPMLLWIADHAWFASRGIAVLAFDDVLLGATSVLLMRWMRNATAPGFRRVALTLAVPVVLFWPAQGQNLIWAVQANSVLSLAALLLALQTLLLAVGASADRRGRGRCLAWLAGTIALLFVSTYSLAYGLLGWPLCLGYLLLRRQPWWMIATFAVAGLAVVGPYAWFWVDVPHHAHALTSLRQPLPVAGYLFELLGSPAHKLIEWPFFRSRTALRGVAGAALFAATTAAALQLALRIRAAGGARETDPSTPLVLLALLGLGCAFVIALGRHNFGGAQSLESRYTIIPCLVWLGTAGYWIPRLLGTRRFALLGYAVTTALLVAMTASYVGHAANSREFAARARIAAMTEVTGVAHPQSSPRLYKDTASRQWLFDSLRRRGHPFFAEPWLAWIGRKAADVLGPPVADRCEGRVDKTSRLEEAIAQLQGWAWDPVAGAPPPLIVVVDEAGVVRGVGATGIERIEVARYFGRLAMLNSGWLAAARTPDAQLEVLAVTSDGSACRLGAASRPPGSSG